MRKNMSRPTLSFAAILIFLVTVSFAGQAYAGPSYTASMSLFQGFDLETGMVDEGIKKLLEQGTESPNKLRVIFVAREIEPDDNHFFKIGNFSFSGSIVSFDWEKFESEPPKVPNSSTVILISIGIVIIAVFVKLKKNAGVRGLLLFILVFSTTFVTANSFAWDGYTQEIAEEALKGTNGGNCSPLHTNLSCAGYVKGVLAKVTGIDPQTGWNPRNYRGSEGYRKPLQELYDAKQVNWPTEKVIPGDILTTYWSYTDQDGNTRNTGHILIVTSVDENDAILVTDCTTYDWINHEQTNPRVYKYYKNHSSADMLKDFRHPSFWRIGKNKDDRQMQLFPPVPIETTALADVDGDGKADAIFVNKDNVVIRRSTGSRFLPPEAWTTNPYYGERGTFFADVTGDGKADAIVVNDDNPDIGKNVVTVRRSDGTRFLEDNEDWTTVPYWGERGTFFADVTGDGKADAIGVNDDSPIIANNRIIVRRSDGTKFLPNETWTEQAYWGEQGIYFADVTGDGKADAIAINDQSPTIDDEHVIVRPSDGEEFRPNQYWLVNHYYQDGRVTFADVSGDGKADIVAVYDLWGITVRPSDGKEFVMSGTGMSGDFSGEKGTRFADVTGDGKADAVIINSVDDIIVRRAGGFLFEQEEIWTRQESFWHITSDGGQITFPDTLVSVVFPPHATAQGLTVAISQLDGAVVPLSNSHDTRVSKVYELTAVNDNGDAVTQFAQAVTVVLQYDKTIVNAMHEFALTMKFYDELLQSWTPLPSVVDPVNHTVTAQTDHFTKFAIFAPMSSVEPTPTPIDVPNVPTPSNSPSVVPEPTTVVLFSIGLLLLLGRFVTRKRR